MNESNIPDALLEHLPPITQSRLKEFLFEIRNYLNDIDFNVQSVKLFDEKSYPPNVVGGRLIGLYEKQVNQPSWFEPACRDEYTFGVVLRLPSLVERPSSYLITADLERFSAKNNLKERDQQAWFPEEQPLPNKMEMIYEVEKRLKASKVLQKMVAATIKQKPGIRKKL